MNRKLQKAFSLLLTAAMLCGLLFTTAFAAEPDAEAIDESSAAVVEVIEEEIADEAEEPAEIPEAPAEDAEVPAEDAEALTDDEPSTGDDDVVTIPASGEITSAAQLALMTSGDYYLGADITINAASWTPVANFTGTLDGNDKTITWSGTSASAREDVGSYFAIIGTNNGTVENLTVDGALYVASNDDVNGVDYVSTVVGYNNGTVENVTNKATLDASGKVYNVGGIVGYNNNGTVSRSANEGDITGYSQVGGIVGQNAGTVEISSNIGDIYGTNAGKSGIGGIAGRNGDKDTATTTGIIRNCYNQGDITSGTPGVSSTQGQWVGGIAGFQNSLSSSTNCYNTGNLVGYGYRDHTAGKNENSTSGVVNCYGLGSATGAQGYDDTIVATDNAMKGNEQVTRTVNNEVVTLGYILNLLNDGGSIWDQTTGSYPVFATGSTPAANYTFAVTTQPTKTVYTAGETFNSAGLVITATNTANGATAQVSEYTISPSRALLVSDTSVTASGTYEGISFSLTIAITVNEAGDIYLNGAAATNGTGTAASPYNDLDDALTAAANTGSDIIIAGTVTIAASGTQSYFDSVTFKRADNFTGALFKITSGTVRLAGSGMVLDGAGTGTLVEVTGGTLVLRGGVTLQNCATAVDVQAGGAVTVNKTSITASQYSIEVAGSTSTFTLEDFGGTEITGTVYLGSGAVITVGAAVPNALTVECANPDEGLEVAVGNYDSATETGYRLDDTDADNVSYVSDDYEVVLDGNYNLVLEEQ